MNTPKTFNRRTAIKLAAGAAATIVTGPATRLIGATGDDGFVDVRRAPDAVTVVTEDRTDNAIKAAAERWEAGGARVRTVAQDGLLRVTLSAPNAAVKQIRLRWNGSTTTWKHVLGDHWERSYGDLQWRRPDSQHINP